MGRMQVRDKNHHRREKEGKVAIIKKTNKRTKDNEVI